MSSFHPVSQSVPIDIQTLQVQENVIQNQQQNHHQHQHQQTQQEYSSLPSSLQTSTIIDPLALALAPATVDAYIHTNFLNSSSRVESLTETHWLLTSLNTEASPYYATLLIQLMLFPQKYCNTHKHTNKHTRTSSIHPFIHSFIW